MTTAESLMSNDVITVTSDTAVEEAIDLMLGHNVSGLPVIDDQGRLVGVISEYNLLSLVYGAAIEQCHVSQYMSTDVVTVEHDASLGEIADAFLDQPIRRVPVLKAGQLAGIVSRRDVLRYIRTRQASEVGADLH